MRFSAVALLAAVCATAMVDLPPKGGSHRLQGGSYRAEKSDLRLWYRQPAVTWNEALPIGNGRLGAMVFGRIHGERLQLNEDTVWAGERRDRTNPAGPSAVPEVRRLLFAGKAAEAEALADRAIIATPRRMPPYQSLGDLTIEFSTSATRSRACGMTSPGRASLARCSHPPSTRRS
jgi:alpha-L-fucosidase 2